MKREVTKSGLVVNVPETMYMLVERTERNRARLGSSVTMAGDTFKVLEEFINLGSLLTTDIDNSFCLRWAPEEFAVKIDSP